MSAQRKRTGGSAQRGAATADDPAFAPPTAADARVIWELVRSSPPLDLNSPYAYLLLCTHFAETGLVARDGDELLGFVLGYCRPDRPERAFVWQVGVAAQARGRGLGGLLLDAWFARCTRAAVGGGAEVRYLEATVTPSNDPSRALFTAFAERHGAKVHESVAFPAELFPEVHGSEHEAELALCIGPVSASHDPGSSAQEPRPSS